MPRLQTTFPDRQTMRSEVPREQFPVFMPGGPSAFDVLRAVRRPQGPTAAKQERAFVNPNQDIIRGGSIPLFGQINPGSWGGGYRPWVPGQGGGGAPVATGYLPRGYAPPRLPQNAVLAPSEMEQGLDQAQLQQRMPSPREQYQPTGEEGLMPQRRRRS